jgi:hypothetical protein
MTAKPSNAPPLITLALIVIFAVVPALIVLVATIAGAEPVELEQDDRAVVDVDRAIRFFLHESPCWGLAMDAAGRRAMAEQIAKAAADNDVPPLLVTLMAKRESSFDPSAIGFSRGEIGILQVHGLAARGCELDTVEGQLACGARWMRRAFEVCGSWDRAIVAYASGRCDAPKQSKLFKNSFSRFRQWHKARAAVDSCGSGDNEHWICEPQQITCVEAIGVINRARASKNGPIAGVSGVQAPREGSARSVVYHAAESDVFR